MNPQHIVSCLQFTLSSNAQERKQAEEQLKLVTNSAAACVHSFKIENAPGCGVMLLQVTASNEGNSFPISFIHFLDVSESLVRLFLNVKVYTDTVNCSLFRMAMNLTNISPRAHSTIGCY